VRSVEIEILQEGKESGDAVRRNSANLFNFNSSLSWANIERMHLLETAKY
jgi:hypothetical protein